MVFCVIFVFGTLLEFTLLIFLQKQVFATKLQRSLTAISMVRSQNRGGSITSGSGSGIGAPQGITGMAMMGGMAGLVGGMGTASVGSGIGVATTQTTPRHEPMENDSNANGGNERIQLTAMSDKKGGKVVSAQALGNKCDKRHTPLTSLIVLRKLISSNLHITKYSGRGSQHRGRCRAKYF